MVHQPGSISINRWQLSIRGRQFQVILGGSLLPGDLLRPFRAGAAQRISKRRKRRFNLIQCFALEVILHGRPDFGYAVSIHRAFSSLAV
jgi:hypothetical protein